MRRHLKVAAVATILLFGARAEGAMLTFQFDGAVTDVTDPSSHLGGSIVVNSPFLVQISFDSAALDQSPMPSTGTYATWPPLTTKVGLLSFISANQRTITIRDGDGSNSTEYDTYRVDDYAFTSNSFDVLELTISLTDPTGLAFANDQLPLQPPDVSLFTYSSFLLQGRQTGTTSPHFTILGHVESISSVPEPHSLMLLAMGGVLLLRRRRLAVCTPMAPILFIILLIAPVASAELYYAPGESPSTTPLSPPPLPLSPPGSELVDIVFVIDGSTSILSSPFQLEISGIRNTFVGNYAFIPSNGTVAIAVVQFNTGAQVDVPLTTIDNSATAQALDAQVGAIAQLGGGTDLGPALVAAVDVLRMGSGIERLIVVATDAGLSDDDPSLNLAEEIRTGTGYAAGLGQTRICSVYINPYPCSVPPESTPQDFLRKLANTADSSGLDGAMRSYPRPNQPMGYFSCAYTDTIPTPLPPIGKEKVSG